MYFRTVRGYRPVLTILTALIAIAIPATARAEGDAPNKERLKKQPPAHYSDKSGQITRDTIKNLQAHGTTPGQNRMSKPNLYERETPFWTLSKGPDYGFRAETGELETGDIIHLLVGDLDTRTGGFALPPELTNADVAPAPGQYRYYLIQIRPSLTSTDADSARTLQAIRDMGVRLEDYVPGGGMIARVDRESLQSLRASSLLQFIQPYHAAYKLDPFIGRLRHPDAAKAASDDYTLSIRFFDGQREAVSASLQALGVEIIPGQATDTPWLMANTKSARVFDVARIEGVAAVYEYVQPVSHSEESQLLVLNGFYTVNTTSSFYTAGVDGSGQRLFDNIGGAVDINGNGIVDAGAQIVSVTDTGLSTGAGDFSETRTSNGVTALTGTNLTFVPNARKMKGYITAAGTGSGGTGDLNSCDGAAEGAFSHGQTTAACAAGNATDVPRTGSLTTPAFDWDGDGTVESYGAPFSFTSGGNQIRVDGVAKGARLYFVDAVGVGGCPESSATGLSPGNLQTVLNNAHSVGARLHNFSFGVATTTPVYSSSAVQIDDFLRLNTQSMLFVSAGNEGADTADADVFHQPATLGAEAQNKNAITVGASRHDARLAVAFFSSVGPAGTAAVRIKPDIMAPGADFGGAGLTADYQCRDDSSFNTASSTDIDCLQNIGHSGTSYSSPNAMGAGAVARDYFATGNYPDGTITNGTNSADRANIVSGALVKALLIASADAMPGNQFGANGTRYAFRYNNETGYGSIDLSNVLPLVNDPNTPLGLIVHDVGDAATPVKVRSLSLPTTISNNTRSIETFKVIDKTQPLRIALAWVDNNGNSSISALTNDLSLEVVDPGVDGTLGNDNDIHYYGNLFTEDFNDDGTIDLNCDIAADNTANETCDFDHDGTTDRSAFSRGICRACGDSDGDGTSNNSPTLPITGLCDANGDGTLTTATNCLMKPNDNANTTEVVILSPDPNGNGQGPGNDADNQLRIGTWRIIVGHPVPTGGTHTAQSYALVIAGGVSLQSSVRLDTNPLKCNGDISVSVSELAEAGDAGCNISSCPTSTVEARTRVEVRNSRYLTDGVDNDADGTIDETLDVDANLDGTLDSGEDLVDLERGGSGIDLIPQGTGLGFESDVRIPASSTSTLRFLFNDGILSVDDSVVLVGIYDDLLGAVTNTRKSTSTVDCVAQIDLFPIGQTGRNVPFLMTGGCDSDKFFDEGEAFSYQVQLGNLDGQTLKDAKVVLRARDPIELDGCDNDNDGTIDENDGTEAAADPCRTVCIVGSPIASCNQSCDFTNLTIHTPANVGGLTDGGAGTDAPGSLTPVIIGEFQQDFLKDVAFAVEVEPGVAFPQQVEMVVGLTAIPAGRTVESCQVFRHLVDANLDRREYSSDFPTGGTTDRDMNADEKISNPIVDPGNPFPTGNQRNNYDKLNETVTFDDLTTTAFGGGNPGFAGPWDFDSDLANHQGFRSGIYGGSSNQGAEITNWGEDQNFNNLLDGSAKCDNPTFADPCTCPGGIYPCVNTVSTPNCLTNGAYFACTGPGNGCFCRTQEDIEGDNDGVLDENHNLLGGCGFASKNNTSRGVWHTGTIAAIGLGTCADLGTLPPGAPTASCEWLDSQPNSLGANLWVEYVATPIINKVHVKQDGALSTNGKDDDADGACVGGTSPGVTCLVGTDCTGGGASCDRIDEDDGADGTLDEGFAYRVELTDWRWNLNADMEAGNSWLTWEPDMDTNSLDPVDVSDGFLFQNNDQGMGPLNGGNPNLTNGFPMFVNNDFGDNTGPAAQRNGVSDQNGDGTIDGDVNLNGIPDGVGNRFSDRSCVFQAVPGANLGPSFKLRDPEPLDDDCDSDIVSYGADGAPGVRGADDDGDGVVDNPSEACPCFNVPDTQDDDADVRTDEIDELQRFWRCKLTPFQACRTSATCTGGGNVCNQFGAPVPYGDDSCGDGLIDENVSGIFAGRDVDGDGTLNDVVLLSENGNRLQQNGNHNIGTINGPFLRFGTVEDFYGLESGTSFQGAIGQVNFEGSGVTALNNTYGMAFDDMVWEWREEHPINQTNNNDCAVGTSPPPPGGGPAGANGEGGGVAVGTNPQCGSVALASDLIFEASTTIPAQVVDVNANAALCTGISTLNASCTQGTLNCNQFGLGSPGLFSNDCDSDGLFELTISVTNLEEPEGETIRLEQDVSSSPVYVGNVSVSSTLNALNDGVIFVQWRGIILPSVTARYFDKSDGVTGFSMGADGRPGINLVDDDGDSRGADKKPGIADLDDDGTGQCSTNSGNPGTLCNIDATCTESGTCTLIDDAHEACRDQNGDGTVNNTDIHFGDDDCTLVDEADELCSNGGVKTLFSDDNCGCALNPREFTVVSSFQDGDALWAYYTVDDNSDGTTSGDGDGLVDDREKIRMDITVRNMSTSLIMEEVEAVLSSRDTDIACVTDASASLGTINSLAFKSTTPSDNFELIVGDVTRTTMLQDKSATFSLAVTGTLVDTAGTKTLFYGTTNPQQQAMDLDLDASVANSNALIATDKKQIIFNLSQHCVFPGPFLGLACTSIAQCGNVASSCPAGSSQCTAGRECYTFTGSQVGAFYTFWNASAFPNRPGLHCQYTNPGNPNVGEEAPKNCFLTQDTGLLNVDNNLDGTLDAGRSDWYLHTALTRASTQRGHTTSQGSTDLNEGTMHMGFERRICTGGAFQNCGPSIVPYNVTTGADWTTYHLNNIMEVYYKTTFKLGLGRGQNYNGGTNDEDSPTLSFWHQMHMADDDMFGLTPPESFDASVVHVLVDRDNDGTPEPGSPSNAAKDGYWTKMKPYYGVPVQQPQPFLNCRFDPDDDGNTENDIYVGETVFGPSSTCFPEVTWGCVGDTQDQPFRPQFGQSVTGAECFTEGLTKINTGGVDENGDGTINGRDTGIATCTGTPANCAGVGGWMEAKFDLMQFRGRAVFIRFLTSAGQFGLNNWIDAFAPSGTTTFTGNRDDGWYIDDMVVSGLQTSGSTFVLKPDIDAPVVNTCPSDNCTANPVPQLRVGTYPVQTDLIDNDTDGTTDEVDETKNGNNPGIDDNGDSTIDDPGEDTPSDAPLRVVTLDASNTTVLQCTSGQLQYEFLADVAADGTTDKVLTGFSTSDIVTDNPECDTLYTVNIRCSTDITGGTPCAATDRAYVKVPGNPLNLAGTLLVTQIGSTTKVSWPAQGLGTLFDLVRGSIQSLASSGGNFTTALTAITPSGDRCMANNTAGVFVNDPKANPAANQGYFYVLRPVPPCGNGYYNSTGVTQVGLRDAEINAATGSCAP